MKARIAAVLATIISASTLLGTPAHAEGAYCTPVPCEVAGVITGSVIKDFDGVYRGAGTFIAVVTDFAGQRYLTDAVQVQEKPRVRTLSIPVTMERTSPVLGSLRIRGVFPGSAYPRTFTGVVVQTPGTVGLPDSDGQQSVAQGSAVVMGSGLGAGVIVGAIVNVAMNYSIGGFNIAI